MSCANYIRSGSLLRTATGLGFSFCTYNTTMDCQWVDTSLNLHLSTPSTSKDYAKSTDGQSKDLMPVDQILIEELQRVTSENKKLTEMLTVMCDKYSALHNHWTGLMSKKNPEEDSRKRKLPDDEISSDHLNISEVHGNECSSSADEDKSCKRPKQDYRKKVSRVLVRTDSSDTSQYVKDGYHWRKYGQKVTRDNPSPRAYFKCSYAPNNCPVRKKVQRSMEDPSVLVAIYEGEHNHTRPAQAELAVGSIFRHGVNLMGRPHDSQSPPASKKTPPTPSVTVDLVQQMAASLTKDPNFTTALATAISGRILDETRING